MAMTIQWLIHEHVLFAQYRGDVTAADIREQYQRGIELCDASSAEYVHMIVDVRAVEAFPKNINTYKDSFGSKAANAGWVVIVGNNAFLRFISTIISNVMHLHIAYVNEMDAALQYIAQRDHAAPYETLQLALLELQSSLQGTTRES
jgi:hypothetical protein